MTFGGTAPRRRRWPWAVAVIDVVALILGQATLPTDSDGGAFILFVTAIASFAGVGALLMTRVPGNILGPLLLLCGTLMAGVTALGGYATLGASASPMWPGTGVAASASEALYIVPIGVAFAFVPLVFPSGRLLSPRWRWVVTLDIALLATSVVSNLIRPGLVGGVPVENPLAIPALEPLVSALDLPSSLLAVVAFGAAATALAIRYRGGTVVVRQQVKWLLAAATVAAVAFPISFVVEDETLSTATFFVGFLAFVALPLAIGVAVLRYRLFEIDRVISRTLSWAIVTGLLAAVFAVGVVGLQAVLVTFTSGDTLAVAASTLVVFGLFQPIRRRVQATVDRRFDRAKVDAEHTVEALASRLRDDVDLGAVRSEVIEAVDAALHPASTGLWLRGSEDAR